MTLPPYVDRATIHKRLQVIFTEGIPQRNYCVREAAASTVFAMLYIGAVEGSGDWLAPKQIYRMTDAPAFLLTDIMCLDIRMMLFNIIGNLVTQEAHNKDKFFNTRLFQLINDKAQHGLTRQRDQCLGLRITLWS